MATIVNCPRNCGPDHEDQNGSGDGVRAGPSREDWWRPPPIAYGSRDSCLNFPLMARVFVDSLVKENRS